MLSQNFEIRIFSFIGELTKNEYHQKTCFEMLSCLFCNNVKGGGMEKD